MPRPVWANFVSPFYDLLGVRFEDWSNFFEECMLDVVAAQELKEDLYGVEASVGDLISVEEFFSMAGPMFEFGESLCDCE